MVSKYKHMRLNHIGIIVQNIEEYKRLLEENGIEFEEKYLW